MIALTQLKVLTLTHPSQHLRHAHLSAASGLVQVGDSLYVVADDENHIGIFQRNNNENGILQRLFTGDLPLTLEERKAKKPDLEVLSYIPPSQLYPQGALLLLGSGSKENRAQGVIMPFNDKEKLHLEPKIIDLTSLYHDIKKELGKLNIEGGVVINENIILFHRGNKKNKVNATICFSLEAFYDHVFSSEHESKKKLNATINYYELGKIDGVPLCFTDATPLPNGAIVFTAAAENTSDAYLDGMCLGSIIGVINSNGELHSLHAIDQLIKAEGVEAHVIDNKVELLLVTDADNENAPASLYSAELIGYPFSV